ncbi:MAG: glycoside hydrolase family 27 protein [Lachnospiraceae bacterium]|nr:glycoside hydrolase family 27 protein [Lachnospiraceae bacterium]
MERPVEIKDARYRFDSFADGEVLGGKKKGRLPAMGWNSWNAFGSGNTEELTKAMADKLCELGLKDLGYEYVVLDDGCYKSERVEGKLSNEEEKFPSGFRALADYIHSKGLKFGMYNDIGTNLCAGAAVGTCGHEKEDARTYLDWGIDFIKVDNCYYLWDNATFSDAENARYTYAPHIKSIELEGAVNQTLTADEGELYGRIMDHEYNVATNIGTFDGTGPQHSPVGRMSGELRFSVLADEAGECEIKLLYDSGKEEGKGEWLQLAVGSEIFYDDLLPVSEGFVLSQPISLRLKKGENLIRIMNHRRQENTLCSYAALKEAFYELDPDNDIVLSICEWGKTQPQNWGYKVGDSWRILNDISFQVGADGNPGHGAWNSDYTTGVTAQYNKAVIMDEFAGLEKGWNDPDMLMVGMDGLDTQMCRTHFTMWCMMNSPLMLGLDLRRVEKNDELYKIIANEEMIALNQDPLGIQAKRVYSSLADEPDKEYIRENERLDILAKPLADGSLAVSFFNLGEKDLKKETEIGLEDIFDVLKNKAELNELRECDKICIKDLWSGEEKICKADRISSGLIPAHGNLTVRISAAGAD